MANKVKRFRRYYTEGTIDEIHIGGDKRVTFSLVPSEKFLCKEKDKKWVLFLERTTSETDSRNAVVHLLDKMQPFSCAEIDAQLLLPMKRDRLRIRVYVGKVGTEMLMIQLDVLGDGE